MKTYSRLPNTVALFCISVHAIRMIRLILHINFCNDCIITPHYMFLLQTLEYNILVILRHLHKHAFFCVFFNEVKIIKFCMYCNFAATFSDLDPCVTWYSRRRCATPV